jgi:hypothetical protein
VIQVKATREGLVGKQTASGWFIDTVYPFVALPSTVALGKWVKLYNPLNGRHCCAQVLDVGPFNIRDDSYVFQEATSGTSYPLLSTPIRPLAERGITGDGIKSNGAGIDLGEKVWNLLDMHDNTSVQWEFINVEPLPVT